MQEQIVISFCKRLASNQQLIRDRTIKKLRKWLKTCDAARRSFSEADLLKLWKGIHYCMWMCDKPINQENLADDIGRLLYLFNNEESFLLFFKAFLLTESTEWQRIDFLRIDKFMMLVRRVLRHAFIHMANHQFTAVPAFVSTFQEVLLTHLCDNVGFTCHLCDVYLEELTSTGFRKIDEEQTKQLLTPFCKLLTTCKQMTIVHHLNNPFFHDLINQALVEDEEETVEDHVMLPVDYGDLADCLYSMASAETCPGKNRKVVYDVVKNLRDMSRGVYPFEEPLPDSDTEDGQPLNVDLAHKRLQRTECELVADDTGGKRKRKRGGRQLMEKTGELSEKVQSRQKSTKKRKKTSSDDKILLNGNDSSPAQSDSADKPPSKKRKLKTSAASPLLKRVRKSQQQKPLKKKRKKQTSSDKISINGNDGSVKKKALAAVKQPEGAGATKSRRRRRKKKISADGVRATTDVPVIPAFINRAVEKVKKKKGRRLSLPAGQVATPVRAHSRRVSFNNRKLIASPTATEPGIPAFDPGAKPTQGILKRHLPS